MGDKALEAQQRNTSSPDIEINWSEQPSTNTKKDNTTQPSHLYFDDPYGAAGIKTNDSTLQQSPESPTSDATEISTYYADEHDRALVGLGADALQGQVDELMQRYNYAPPPSLLGLPANASERQINQALQAKMRDNVGLPSNATDQEYLQRLGEYKRLFDVDEIAAFRRAENGLPPSATTAQLDLVRNAYKDASLRASLGLSQLEPDGLVGERLAKLNGMDRHERADILGIPRDPMEMRRALDDRIKDNLGLPREATRTDMLQRLMKYNEVASKGATESTDAYLRAQYGLDPTASLTELRQAQESFERARHKIELGLPLTATQQEVLAKSAKTGLAERQSLLGLTRNATNKEYGDALDNGIKRELGLPKDATRSELMQGLCAYERLAAINPEGAFMRAKLGLSMSAGFEEVQAALSKRLRPDE